MLLNMALFFFLFINITYKKKEHYFINLYTFLNITIHNQKLIIFQNLNYHRLHLKKLVRIENLAIYHKKNLQENNYLF